MAHHVMGMSLFFFCLLAFIDPGICLKCLSCRGTKNCQEKEVTCSGANNRCSTSVLSFSSYLYKYQSISKSCSDAVSPSKNTLLSIGFVGNLSLQESFCDTDLCNKENSSKPAEARNNFFCFGCVTPGKKCDSSMRTQIQCTGDQKQCVDLSITGTLGDITDVSLKGCGKIDECSNDVRFYSQTSSLSVRCCSGNNYCNEATEFVEEQPEPNGVECYSCNTADGQGCSTDKVKKVNCYGSLTSCLEAKGMIIQDGSPVSHVIKGCATPAMCSSSVLTLMQKMDSATVQCCDGNLCNSKFNEQSSPFPTTESTVSNPGSNVTAVHSGSANGNSSINNGTAYFDEKNNTFVNIPGVFSSGNNGFNPNVSLTPYSSSGNGSNIGGSLDNINSHNTNKPIYKESNKENNTAVTNNGNNIQSHKLGHSLVGSVFIFLTLALINILN